MLEADGAGIPASSPMLADLLGTTAPSHLARVTIPNGRVPMALLCGACGNRGPRPSLGHSGDSLLMGALPTTNDSS